MESAGKVVERFLPGRLPEAPGVTGPRGGARFSPHCRPDGAPNHTDLLLHLPEFDRNPRSRGQSAIFLVSRAEPVGRGVEAESFFVEEKQRRVFPVCWLDAAVIGVPHTFMGGF